MAASGDGLRKLRLTAPVSEEDLKTIRPGDIVFLDGVIYTGREGVYRKVVDEGAAPPVDLRSLSNVNFHCSPAAAVQDDGSFRIGAVTATASFRFSRALPAWFAKTGCKMVVGKGGMNPKDYRDTFVPAGAVYLTTVGYGTGALLGRGIREVLAAHWIEELGIAQAMWVFRVENFGPLIADSDLAGNSLFEQQNAEINKRIEKLYEGLKLPALRRHGETDDKTEELI
ncbi:MAG: fumarate hydratase C-terminal domain-containing protein [Alphaproteobacteria bacterium]|nr:fumarate hydratase C-terminal domain-containing protein [Alphaproteobacteria bacterium]